MSNRGILWTSAAVMSTLAVSVLLGGCASVTETAASGPTSSPVDSSTPSSSPSPTATPTPSPRPLDARSAWEACARVAQDEYVAENDGSEIYPFGPTTELQTDADGNTTVAVGVKPAHTVEGMGSILITCVMTGTADDPHVVRWFGKDI